MCELKISILLIFQIFVFSLCGQLFNRRAIKITRLDLQCLGKNVPVENYLKGVKCDTTSAFVQNSTVVLKENFSNNVKYNVTFNRCKTRENLDTCEKFYQLENKNFCQLVNPDGILGQSPLAIHYIPKMKCPGKKGVYHAYNYTLNLTPFIIVPIDNWYWKIEYNIYAPDENRLLSCGSGEGYTVMRTVD